MTQQSSLSQAEHTAADYYFDSYAHFGIHEEMLKDTVRTRSYQQSILGNAHLYKDKIVLDVGCGTGILSLFAAKAGAKHVYGIERSAIAEQAQQIVLDNGYQDKVTIIRGKVEEVDLPVQQVDIIISEWMGYFLMYESMLDTVLYARDKWLVPDGLLMPDKCTLSLVAIEDAEYRHEKIDFWDDVYGFNMKCIKGLAMQEPLVDVVDQEQVATKPCLMATFNLSSMTKEDASFTVSFKLVASRNDYIHAFVAYFDVYFTHCHKLVWFSTSPMSRSTHWKQTVLYLQESIVICEGEVITGSMSCTPNVSNPRDLDLSLTYSFKGKNGSCSATQSYRMR
ncbi:probable protein arginine N-methyltransferase 1 [Coccomyxa sp. Obi]|nr:probable protein arginine N-methyltransferase 1 [Coccomyxa sp. Obi]